MKALSIIGIIISILFSTFISIILTNPSIINNLEDAFTFAASAAIMFSLITLALFVTGYIKSKNTLKLH